jgi:alanine-glyoxylate transaminase/serine-glyoxylate transaminase/serine-pyruvate transaminase
MDYPTMDHRGPAFADLGHKVLSGMQSVFKTSGPVVIFPSSGTGAWEAAMVNTLSPGDKVVMVETGHFASLWTSMAGRLGLDTEAIPTDWRRGVDPNVVEDRLKSDSNNSIKALCVVHNETSTGATTRLKEVRDAMNAVGHPALLMVDTISGLACADFRFDDWGVDVAVSGSQKGLMLPPGLSFNAVSEKALAASKTASLPGSYWAWGEMLEANRRGYFPYTPATNMLYGLAEAIDMLHEEGMENVFARHRRHGEATRRAVAAWGLETQCVEEKDFSPVLTGVRLPDGHDADRFRATVLESFDMSLGNGLSKIAGKVFRIGHLGDFNDLMLIGTLSGVEMGLGIAGIPHRTGGVSSAMDFLKDYVKAIDRNKAA